MASRFSRFRKYRDEAQAVWDESALGSQTPLTAVWRFAHFWVMVWKSFAKNRCPVRASALAYATLLALIPMLAVVMSITSSFLKKEGESRIDDFIVRFVASVTPPAMVSSTNEPPDEELVLDTTNAAPSLTNATPIATNAASALAQATNLVLAFSNAVATVTNLDALRTNAAIAAHAAATGTNAPGGSVSSLAQDERAIKVRKEIARRINVFIQNTRSGTLGVTGSVLLIFVAISMLTRIEDTFNDIWGVVRGRTWFMRIVLYWGVISLAPLLLVVALGLTTGPHLESTRKILTTTPFIGHLIFQFLPVVMLCLTFGLFYILMPNTKVRWQAALVGGLVGGILFHLNNAISVLYVSRVVSNSKIYGSLGLVPVFMVGLYFSWLILLFGAQVAYAYQNRATYVEEKQVEQINQRGREFVALRLMTRIGQRFLRGEVPVGIAEIGREMCVPTKLIQQTMHTLAAARLVVETTGVETAYVPARPLQDINCYDILEAMRAAQGQELSTRDEPTRGEVYGEFHRIQEAERKAASTVTLLALAVRAQAQLPEGLPHHTSNGPKSDQ